LPVLVDVTAVQVDQIGVVGAHLFSIGLSGGDLDGAVQALGRLSCVICRAISSAEGRSRGSEATVLSQLSGCSERWCIDRMWSWLHAATRRSPASRLGSRTIDQTASSNATRAWHHSQVTSRGDFFLFHTTAPVTPRARAPAVLVRLQAGG